MAMAIDLEATPTNPICEHCGKRLLRHHRGEGKIRCEPWPNEQVFRRAKSDMPKLGISPHPDVPCGSYIHAKGDRYEVIGGVFQASGDSATVLVLYQSVQDGYLACRNVTDFRARFTAVEASEP